MGTKLYVGNLSFNTTENELQDLFAQAGAVQEVTLMQDKFTGKSRGFAFVTMSSEADAQKAITEFNGKTVKAGRSRSTKRVPAKRVHQAAVVAVVAMAAAAAAATAVAAMAAAVVVAVTAVVAADAATVVNAAVAKARP